MKSINQRRMSSELVLDQQVEEVACLLVRVLKAVHLTDHQILDAMGRACKKENPKLVPNPAVGNGGLLGNIVRRWMDDPRFVGPDGRPKALAIKGKNGSFTALVKETIPDMSVSKCLDGLIKMRAVVRVGSNKVRCVNSVTTFIGHRATFVGDALVPLAELLRIIAWSLTDQLHGAKPKQLHRGVLGVEIPKKNYSELYQLVSKHGLALLEMLDAWATQRSSPVTRKKNEQNADFVRPYIGIFLSAGREGDQYSAADLGL